MSWPKPASSWAPISAERAWKVPSSSIATTSVPMAAASGLPPKVEPWEPGVMTSMTSWSAAIAETG